MDFDWPKISLFKVGKNDYSFSPPRNPHRFNEKSISENDYDIGFQMDDIRGIFKKKVDMYEGVVHLIIESSGYWLCAHT